MTENNSGNNNFSPNNTNLGNSPTNSAAQNQGQANPQTPNQQYNNTQNTNMQQNPAFRSAQNTAGQGVNPQFAQNQTRPNAQTPQGAPRGVNQGQPNMAQAPKNAQMPQQNFENKKVLTEEDKERLRAVNNGNAEIKKLKKRYKKATLTENARPLYKVRRLYSARLSHRLYFEHMLEIARLRALASESGKKGAALIGAAAKKTRNLVAALLIVFAILAVIGTGTLVTVLVINQDQRDLNLAERLEIVGQNEFEADINNYQLGTDTGRKLSVLNNDVQNVLLALHVTIEPNEALKNDIDSGATDLTLEQLEWNPNIVNSNNWFIQGNNLYYIGSLEIGDELQIFDDYNLDLRDGYDTYNEWSNGRYGVVLNFSIEYHSQDAVNLDILNWPQGWKDAYSALA